MELKVIGSNSAGNSYLLISATDTLLIECGVHFSKIKQALNFKVSNVSAIVSHSHGDHSTSMKDVLNAGISIYSGIETFQAKGLEKHHRASLIEAGTAYNIGSFKVKPFNVNHDVPCFGFMISHPEMGLTIFLTDTFYSDYTFRDVNHFIVECNHAQDIIETNGTKEFLRNRVIKSHMNLDTCKTMLLANDLTRVISLVLIHLSDNNSDARRFKREIEEVTGKAVHIARPGLNIPLNKTAF